MEASWGAGAKHDVPVFFFFGFITGCVPLLYLAFSSHLISSGCLSIHPSLLLPSSPSLSIICGVRSRSKRITAALCRTHYLTTAIYFLGNVRFRRCEVNTMVEGNLDENTEETDSNVLLLSFKEGTNHQAVGSYHRIVATTLTFHVNV